MVCFRQQNTESSSINVPQKKPPVIKQSQNTQPIRTQKISLDQNTKLTKHFTEEKAKENILDIAQIKIENADEIDKLAVSGDFKVERSHSENFKEISKISLSSESLSRGNLNSDFIESEQNELSFNHNDMKINDSMINKGFQGGSITERPVMLT